MYNIIIDITKEYCICGNQAVPKVPFAIKIIHKPDQLINGKVSYDGNQGTQLVTTISKAKIF